MEVPPKNTKQCKKRRKVKKQVQNNATIQNIKKNEEKSYKKIQKTSEKFKIYKKVIEIEIERFIIHGKGFESCVNHDTYFIIFSLAPL